MTRSERLLQARASMDEASLLSREHMGNKAVLTNLYHAMVESLFALLDISVLGNMTHADVIERFEREYVRTGKFDSATLDVIRRSYDLTHECDCEHMLIPADADIDASKRTVEALIHAAERLPEAR